MQTLRLTADPGNLNDPTDPLAPSAPPDPSSPSGLDQAAAILRRGGTVAFPIETVYGLGANALNEQAVAAIFAAKQRPAWDPLIVHVCDEKMLSALVREIPPAATRLMQAFWPAPLTLLLPRSSAVPDAVTAGRRLVGIRMPSHPVAHQLIRRAGVPLAAPSANRFGHTSPTTAQHVLDDLDGRIDAVLDAGPTAFGLESTVVDPTLAPIVIYRPGAITLQEIQAVAGPAQLFAENPSPVSPSPEALPSPGVGLRHYAPHARLILIEVDDSNAVADVAARVTHALSTCAKERVGVMLPSGLRGMSDIPQGQFAAVFAWGDWSKPEELAHRLFAGLRQLDAQGCSVILCPVPPPDGIGAAMRDRLRKAAFRSDGPRIR